MELNYEDKLLLHKALDVANKVIDVIRHQTTASPELKAFINEFNPSTTTTAGTETVPDSEPVPQAPQKLSPFSLLLKKDKTPEDDHANAMWDLSGLNGE